MEDRRTVATGRRIPPMRCPSCNRQLARGEKPSSYAGVKVCAGCAAIQKAGDALEQLEDLRRQLGLVA